ncbi:hypothetical protein DFP72DRAFT_846432 [Ephemerocybe angulata]|uniref:CxC5 like cysteine cluster associated with KDZ domain-containing protein n=1 Tax=Ephemerocybe angulata TaxID=980116 RepID=A0A8H6I0A0_9AGAR|nr:hypothetical protein DFP72DRAFT_846432 [Tulosesus angulatus]
MARGTSESVVSLSSPIPYLSRPLSGTSVLLYCQGCHMRYYYNYYVQNGKTCMYYWEARRYIHSAEHVFVDEEICTMFSSMMLNAWTSGTNCSRVYNMFFAEAHRFEALLPIGYSTRLKLDTELGLKERNDRFVGTGQPEWNHTCSLCCWVEEKDGVTCAVQSVVVDGVAIGRPCCGVYDCKRPANCAKSVVEKDYRTCPDPKHRVFETWVNEKNKAMFQLKQRKANAEAGRIEQPLSKSGDPDSDSKFEVDNEDICKEKTKTKIKAHFSQRRTHNEELCVASCGVILGRATFYGLEALNGVLDGKWRFNSSAAEQTNNWFGKYLQMTREMEAVHYNFFLDEMIKQRNQILVNELRAKGRVATVKAAALSEGVIGYCWWSTVLSKVLLDCGFKVGEDGVVDYELPAPKSQSKSCLQSLK